MLDTTQVVKYLLEGIAVAVAGYYLTGKKTSFSEITSLGLVAAIVFLILDMFAPSIAAGARQGSGFGIGFGMVGGGSDQTPVEDSEYKLVDGQYSHKVLRAGYNKNVVGYNSISDKFVSNVSPWTNAVGTQEGGAPDESGDPEEANTVSVVPVEEEEVKTNDVVLSDNMNRHRIADALYSGDLVHVISDGNYLQRGVIDSQIVLDKPLELVGSNLSKLRLAHANKHDSNKQIVLNYGDPLHLKHNTYFNNRNEARFVKYGEKLQSHQEGPLFRVFKIYDPDNLKRVGPIEPNTDIIMCRGDQDGINIYLKQESDKTLSTSADQQSATRFKVVLNRVYELHDRNLCVGPNEILYP
jgi:hypothetical protein